MPSRSWIPPTTFLFLLMSIAVASPLQAQSGAWTSLAPAPTKRTEVAAAALNRVIYVVGGFSEPGLGNLTNLGVTDTVEVYDPSSDRWSTARPLPAPLHHAGAAALDGHVYVIGGFTTGFLSLWTPVKTAYRFDPAVGGWTELPTMPTARGALGLAAIEGKLYAVGGIGDDGNTGAVEVYDPKTNEWSRKAPLPTPRDHLAVAAARGRLYAIGGRLNGSYSRNLDVVEVYDPEEDRWRTAASLPTARSGIAAGVIQDTIYVVGGEGPDGTFATNEAYSPGQDRWRTAAPMPTARHGLGAAVLDGRLYVLSGGPTPGGSFSNVNERFDPPQLQASPLRTDRTPVRHVGTVMALLATFQDAKALPEESRPEATGLIRALIQLQAAFMKSSDPAVQQLLRDALATQGASDAAAAVQAFRSDGWTSRSLEAVIDYVQDNPVWDRPEVVRGLQDFNIGRAEFQILASVFGRARAALASEGRDLHAVYATWRREMPGATP